MLSGTPAVENERGAVELAKAASTLVVGADNTQPLEVPNMGAEDYG